MKINKLRNHRAFTLVELLVVIAIIALLAALITPAVYFAVNSAKNATYGVEIASIEKALEAYKLEMGEYPPDFSELAQLNSETDRAQLAAAIISAHLQRTFRRRDIARDLPRVSPNNMGNVNTAFLANLSPENALIFWLRGFSSDPQLPLFGPGERRPFFEFDQGRIAVADDPAFNGKFNAVGVTQIGNGNIASDTPGFDLVLASGYFPPGSTEEGLPYVYYRSSPIAGVVMNGEAVGREGTAYLSAVEWARTRTRPGGPGTNSSDRWSSFDGTRVPPMPALSSDLDVPGQTFSAFVAPRKFQIFAAGLDNTFSTFDQQTIEGEMSTPLVNGASHTNYNNVNTGVLEGYFLRQLAEFPDPRGDNASLNAFSDGHQDNVTNFSGGKTLEASKTK